MEPPPATGARPAGRPGVPPDPYDQAVSTLTAAQHQAVASTAPALCIIAGAGSGKTRVLTLRAARRIRDGSADADHTVICTFTRKAATELRHRLTRYGVTVSTPAPPGGAPGPGARTGTLHQLGLTLLRRHAFDAGQAPPSVAERRDETIRGLVGDPALAPAVAAEIGWAKANGLTPGSYADGVGRAGRPELVPVGTVVKAFTSYEASLARRKMLDLDDVLLRSADLLLDDETFARHMHWRYRHLSVDEFQDVNPAQFRLIMALLGTRQDLCAVGDPNQAIYGWNGADPGLIADLGDHVPGLEVVRLDENHRSTPQVVRAAAAALGPTGAVPPRSAAADGPLPVVTAYDDDEAEADGVVAVVSDRAAGGMRWSDQAVLARTHDQLATVRRALTRAGIPHRTAPGPDGGPTGPTGAGPRRPPGDTDAVELATFHRAKGLEWTSVMVVGLEDGFVPIVHAGAGPAREEERRLLYVALTRASTDLYCSWARVRTMGGGRRVERRPSPWLAGVARVSRTGPLKPSPVDTGRRIAAIRAALRT